MKMCRRVFLKQKRERKRKWQSVTTQLLFCHQLNICAAHYKYESSLKRKSQCHWWSQRWCSKLFLNIIVQTSLKLPSSTKYHKLPLCFKSYPPMITKGHSSHFLWQIMVARVFADQIFHINVALSLWPLLVILMQS